VDAWLASRFQEWTQEPPRFEGPFERSAWEWTGRERVYTRWLAGRLENAGTGETSGQGAARLLPDSVRMVSFERRRMHRRGGGRPERPDVTLTGSLRVHDADVFRALLRRGVGRHRAFGFGMLRVRPRATAC
jgi:CRISPR system Cascade subunit CasE